VKQHIGESRPDDPLTDDSARTQVREARNQRTPSSVTHAIEENVQTIRSRERASLLSRSRAERLADWIAGAAATAPALILHAVGFALWIAANTSLIRGVRPFDPFPFPFLTMIVSLEAIFLSLFVLASQNRLARQADKRSELDLQIDLLAEREMTAVLRLLQDIARHLNVTVSVTPDQLRDLVKKTDLKSLTEKMDEVTDGAKQRRDRPT
jgi:uncharacterized membrane protein